jgi:hypothetical protein
MDENLKNNFFIDESPDDKKIEDYTRKIMPYCRPNKQGEPIFVNDNIKTLDRIKAFLVLRYITNHWESAIPREITPTEFEKLLDIEHVQLKARLKDVRDEKFADVTDNGSYRVKVHKIPEFLDKLVEKYGKAQA